MNPAPTTPNAPESVRAPAPRRVLVTGGARRLGREIALAMAKAGWQVALHYGQSADDARDTVERIREAGGQAVALQGDLADEASVNALFDAACAQLGPLTCVVNNASRFEPDRPETVGFDTLARHMAPNLAAPLLLARRLHALHAAAITDQSTEAAVASATAGADLLPSVPSAKPPTRGVVINLLDQKLENPNPDFLSYTLSKAALLSATTLLAMAFAPVLRVVAVSPGITLRSGDQTEAEFARAHQMTPLGASSTPQDIAAAVLFLADAPAITGVNLTVDGGQHLMALPRDVMFLTRDSQ